MNYEMYSNIFSEYYRNVEIQWDFWKAPAPSHRHGVLFKYSQLWWVRSHTNKIYTHFCVAIM